MVRDLSVDSTVCRTQQHAAGAPQAGRPAEGTTERCVHRARRSRAGTLARWVHHQAPPGHRAGSETHSIVVTAGQCGDSPQFEPRVPRVGPGRPRVHPDRVRADKAYASRRNRTYLRRRGSAAPSRTRPTTSATVARLPRWPSAEVRPGGLRGQARGRVRHQPPQKTPGPLHQIRQARSPLRSTSAVRRSSGTTASPDRPAPLSRPVGASQANLTEVLGLRTNAEISRPASAAPTTPAGTSHFLTSPPSTPPWRAGPQWGRS
ncbi:transposase [Streptomyces sp. NPDC101117]|uniref:transposase n=1 Tax=Streptomyces sp. NPDC101117 TaxID=3366108 RepID=UPI00380496AF